MSMYFSIIKQDPTKRLNKLLAIVVMITLLQLPLFAQDVKVSDDIHHVLEKQGSVDCIVVMKAQWKAPSFIKNWGKVEKTEFVYDNLQLFAEQSQKSLQDFLTGETIVFRSYSVFNGIATTLTSNQIEKLITREDISHILYNEWHKNDLGKNAGGQLIPIEWGIEKINADLVWEMGYEGDGVVIAGQDTGYDFDNPLITEMYRGYNIGGYDHNYHWHDAIHGPIPAESGDNPCGFDSKIPCDDHNHGTHTMGTMVGQDSENGIGVAPKAQWIGCRNMDQGNGRPETYIECFEWFLAPTDLNGNFPNPSMAPHIINNSWGCPESENCNPNNWIFMETVINNLVDAGIMVVVSSGNDGSLGCESINRPPSMFENSFVVGASDIEDNVPTFSSKGLVTNDNSFLLKPDVVAPGVQVRSITLNGFGSWNGTSMAGPHVVGTAALLINANPELAGQVEAISEILRETAIPITDTLNCNGISGETIPNPIAGYGRINALAAVEKALLWEPESIESNPDNDFVVTPNPSDGKFTVKSNIFGSNALFTLYDAKGSTILQENIYTRLQNFEIELPTGIYFYTIVNGENMINGKLLMN